MKHRSIRSVWSQTIVFGVCLGLAAVYGETAEGQVRKEINLAEPAFEQHVWFYQNASFLRLNPIGLVNRSQLGYKYALFNSDNIVLKDTYAGLSFVPTISPTFTRLGGRAELKPLALLRFSAQYEWVGHFGTFGTISSAPTPNADFTDDARNTAQDEGTNYATSGTILTLGSLIQAKAGPIAARTQLKAIRQELDLNNGDTVFYDIILDVIAPQQGWLYTADTDILFLAGKLTLGVRHTFITTSYKDSDFLPGESTENLNTPTQRVGPLVAYRFYDAPGASIDQPTLFMLLNTWVQHRYRTGEDVSQAVPYFVIGFSFNGKIGTPTAPVPSRR
ncbi:MAG: hypothetical protein AAFS10_01625 [Myxococcota bacterium]